MLLVEVPLATHEPQSKPTDATSPVRPTHCHGSPPCKTQTERRQRTGGGMAGGAGAPRRHAPPRPTATARPPAGWPLRSRQRAAAPTRAPAPIQQSYPAPPAPQVPPPADNQAQHAATGLETEPRSCAMTPQGGSRERTAPSVRPSS